MFGLSLTKNLKTAHAETLDAERIARYAVIEQTREKERRVAAEDETERVLAVHTGQLRIASADIDPISLTTKLRSIQPTLRVETDHHTMTLYADRELTESELNAVEATLRWNLTKT